MHKPLAFILISLTLRGMLFAGSSLTEPAARSLLRKGDAFIEREVYDSAATTFQKALAYYESAGDCHYTAYCYLWLGEASYGMGRYEEALATGLKSKAIADNCPGRDSMDFYSMILQNIGVFYSKLGDFDKQMTYYQKAFRHILDFHGRYSERGADAFFNLGVAYGRRGQWNRAIAYFDTSLAISQRLSYSAGIASTYLNLSYAYQIKEDYMRAIDYQRRSLKITTRTDERARGLNNLGVLYSDLGQTKEALYFLGKALELREKQYGRYHDDVLSTLFNICRVHFEAGDHETANEFIDRTIEGLRSAPRKNPGFLKIAYHYKAVMLSELGRLVEAEAYARQALHLGGRQLDIDGSSLLVLSTVLLARGQYDEGLQHAQAALVHEVPGFGSTSIFDNPPLHAIQNPRMALNLLSVKGRLLYHRGAARQSEHDLSQSLNTYLLADSIVSFSRRTYQDNTSKELLAANARKLYAGAVAAGYHLFKISGDVAYLDLVFTYSEKNRALLVLEKMHDLYAKDYYGIPRKLLAREQRLLQDIEFYSNRLRYGRAGGQSPREQLEKWEATLSNLRRQQEAMIDQLRDQYPAYYTLKHDLSSASPDAIRQELLGENEVLIEYFVAASHLYLFIIDREKSNFIEVLLPGDLSRLVDDFRRSLVRQEPSFFEKNHDLYKLLLEPAEQFTDGKDLVIVPDGALGYVPFEVLLKKEVAPEQYYNFRGHPYLIKEHGIRYLFSASLALKEKAVNRTEGVGRVLALAPSFEGEPATGVDSIGGAEDLRKPLTSLPGSAEEIQLLADRFRGDFWQGSAAKESHFKEQAANYRLLHITTHTIINERFPSFSKLVFAAEEGEKEDGFLHIYELYGMRLHAELIVLSACNTGIGIIKEGEGIASLARAFAYAGSPNLIMSLWPVKDNTTPKLMARFYNGLSAGMRKGEALRIAKLDYLKEENELFLHPYYWGTFIYTGDRRPIALKRREAFVGGWLWPVGTLFLIAGGIIWWRRRGKE
jgi:CHAT domain-containing protein/tetratricopeptide (TPR) repeat protein